MTTIYERTSVVPSGRWMGSTRNNLRDVGLSAKQVRRPSISCTDCLHLRTPVTFTLSILSRQC